MISVEQTHLPFLVRYLSPRKNSVFGLATLLLGGIALRLINPQILRYFIDTTQSNEPLNTLVAAALLFIGLSMLDNLIRLVTNLAAQNLAWLATNDLRQDLTLHCLHLDLSFHKKHTPGELIERVDGDVSQLSNYFSHFSIQLVGNGLLALGILALLFWEDVRVGLGLALYTLLVLLVLGKVQRFAVECWANARQAAAEMYGFLEERISGAEEIQAAGAENYMIYQLARLLRLLLRTVRKAYLLATLAHETTNLLFALGYAVGLALAVYLYTQGDASIGTAYLIIYYIGMLTEPLQNIRSQVLDLQQAAASINRVSELLSIEPGLKDQAVPGNNLPHGSFSVEFKDVWFRYEDNENVLEEISFKVTPGRVLGILGRTGSGKTTLIRLLFRLYDPTRGQILLGDLPITSLSFADLRARVGMVTQDVQLFQASVRDNVTFFNRSVTDVQIEEALNSLGLWRWVQSLPQGLDTSLASGGHGLSAGEAQLLAFARVFLRNPGLVILDEASSRLDPATENRLEQAVSQLFSGRTGIIIAHRLHTVLRADDILILEEGRVIEYGPRQELESDPSSRFSTLLRTGMEEVLG